jgi:hypothetical protein
LYARDPLTPSDCLPETTFGALLPRPIITHWVRERIENDRKVARRVFGLTDRWLAEYLLQEARALQVELCSARWKSTDDSCDAQYAWHIIPEIAKRLGARHFLAKERMNFEIRTLTAEKLRQRAIIAMTNLGVVARTHPLGCRRAKNGNPVAIALDRLALPAANEPFSWRKRTRWGRYCPEINADIY